MSYIPAGKLFGLDVAMGDVSGVSGVEKFGNNTDVDAAEDIWSQGGDWVQPTAARIHSIVSDSAADDASPAGTGALTLTVEGLNGAYAVTTETVSLNGLVAVLTANSYFIIHRMTVATAGSGGTNAGNITATAAVDVTVTAAVVALMGQTQMGIYQVPAGYTAYIGKATATMQNSAGSTEAQVGLLVKPFGGAWNRKINFDLSNAGSSVVAYDYLIPLVCTEKSIIKLRCGSVSRTNTHISGTFSLYLVAN